MLIGMVKLVSLVPSLSQITPKMKSIMILDYYNNMILAYNETGWTSDSLLVQGSGQLETRFSCNCDHRHWQIILTFTICKNTREHCITGKCIFTKLCIFFRQMHIFCRLVSILPAKFRCLDQVDSVAKTSK